MYSQPAVAHMFGVETSRRIEPLRHKSGSNAMFVDGHAATLHQEVMTDLASWDDRIYFGHER